MINEGVDRMVERFDEEEAQRIILFIVSAILFVYFTTDLGKSADVDPPTAQLFGGED
jgi:hypothetical protein